LKGEDFSSPFSKLLKLSMKNKEQKPGFLQRLQTKWKLDSLLQVVLVLVVFACTGFTILFIKNPVLDFFGVEKGGFVNTVLYLLLVLPLYQIFLLIYGFIFGQFRFFWEKEKQIFRRIAKLFSKKSD
jgi:hypothetical protein|tara:strand:+ start:2774 stop:3154 length:381 start_codon:yes stop_codon:yes gene_type:complete